MKTPSFLQHALLASLLLGMQAVVAHTVSDPALDKPSGQSLRGAAPQSAPGKPGRVKGMLRTSKTSLDVRIDYSFNTPAEGAMSEVRLKIAGNQAGRPLSIEVAPGAGLRMVSGLAGGSGMTALQSSASSEHTITVSPTSEGLHYIHVFLRSGDMSEALAIAMPVGKDQKVAKPIEPLTLPDGRRIIAVPAQR